MAEVPFCYIKKREPRDIKAGDHFTDRRVKSVMIILYEYENRRLVGGMF